MKKLKLIMVITISIYAAFVFLSGFTLKRDDIQATQKDLDMSTTPAKLSVTGTPLGPVSIAHNGRDISPDSSFRDSYTNMTALKETIKPGTVFTKRVYIRKKDGSKGDLEMIFAMIKHQKGYFPDGGDWEYVKISAEKSVDYKLHPNGMLPSNTDDQMRGKITMCAGCHMAAAEKDFIFTNSDVKPICNPKTKCNPCKPKCNPCKPKTKCNPCKPK